MTALDDYLTSRADRCSSCGWHAPTMGHGVTCAANPVAPDAEGGITDREWAIFVAALRTAEENGQVSQTAMRPLISGIFHKHRGLCYSRARREGLIAPVGKEESTDAAGKNTDKDQKVYELRSAA